jgi:hypothetical protein
MNFFEINNDFRLPEGFTTELLDTLPIRKHHYGQPMEETASSLYWTEYQPFQAGDGTISFARALFLQYPDTAQYVANYITSFFPNLPLDYRRINLLKTCGSIRVHKDENNRKCCINIGIKNSTGAVTKTSSTLDHAIFEDVAVSHVCQDGYAYLLDTSRLHRVIAVNDQPRYLFTYGFARTFEEVHQFYKPE